MNQFTQSFVQAKNIEFQQLLGEGSFGIVYKNVQEQKTYAVKILKEDPQWDVEIQIIKNLSHPNLIKIYRVQKIKKQVYIFMEICEGGTLEDYMNLKHRVPQQDAKIIMRQIFEALDYIHLKNIIHRDIKPSIIDLQGNIMFRQKKNIYSLKISDFGLSKIYGLRNNPYYFKQICGTWKYMAPQIFTDFYTKKVDMWAAGVVMYTLLSGYHPFLYRNQSQRDYELLSYFGSQLVIENNQREANDLLSNLLVLNCEHRYLAHNTLTHKWVSGKNYSKIIITVEQRYKLFDYQQELVRYIKSVMTLVFLGKTGFQIVEKKDLQIVLDEKINKKIKSLEKIAQKKKLKSNRKQSNANKIIKCARSQTKINISWKDQQKSKKSILPPINPWIKSKNKV